MDQNLIAEELKKANAYLENIFENSPDAIGIVDNRGRFIKWNKMAAELYGYTFEQLLGKSSFDLYADRNELDRMLAHLRREGLVKNWGNRNEAERWHCPIRDFHQSSAR